MESHMVMFEQGDVLAIRVSRHGDHLMLAVFDGDGTDGPLIQATLCMSECHALIQALLTEMVTRPITQTKGVQNEERQRLHDRTAHQEPAR